MPEVIIIIIIIKYVAIHCSLCHIFGNHLCQSCIARCHCEALKARFEVRRLISFHNYDVIIIVLCMDGILMRPESTELMPGGGG